MASEFFSMQNRGICDKCGNISPAHHEVREGRVYLIKDCAECGETSSLVSSNAERYTRKREMLDYTGDAQHTCSLNCPTCNKHKDPTLVFIDTTNRCNMNCPICLANIPAMGFRFDPPMEYFEKIFERLSRMDPKPKIQLFGGEPTVRKDLIDIITIAKKKYGLSARVVTNGLKLADEEYCRDLLATGTELMFSYDGRHPEIYSRTRKHPKAYELKTKALENIARHRKRKITIMCCVGEEVNGEYMADMVEYCHEARDSVAALDLIPLTTQWGPEAVDVSSSTIEDLERIMANALPGMEFFPAAALYQMPTLRSTFDLGRLTFGGAHPNCEAVSLLISDGKKYHPVSKFLKGSFNEAMTEVLNLDRAMGERLKKSWIARAFGHKGRQWVYGAALFGLIRRRVNLRAVFNGNPWLGLGKIVTGLVAGKKMKDLLRRHTQFSGILRVMILPFEEKAHVEAARLVDCPAAFAYEHPDTREIRLMPVCAWPVYKNEILRLTSEHYGALALGAAEAAEAAVGI